MPKKPVTKLSGRKIAVSTVSARMMSLVRLLCSEKCICTAVSADASSRRTCVQHALDVLEHVARAHAQLLALAPLRVVARLGPFLERVDPFGDRRALVLAGVLEQAQRVARVEQQAPAAGTAARVEQLLLQLVDLLASGGGAARGSCRPCSSPCAASGRPGWSACARWPRPSAVDDLVLQPVGEELAHLAVGRMHGEQDAVEDDEADRAGVDRGDRARRAVAGVPVSSSIAARCRRRRRGGGTPAGRRPRCSRSATAAGC